MGAGLEERGVRLDLARSSQETLRVADPATGAVRDVLEETVPTFFESGNGRVNWRYLPATNEVIWFSERDNWGQLYLYDLQTGKLKRQITSGEGNVTQLVRIDEKRRLLFVQAVGREKGRDPYFTHLYKVNMDGGIPALLTPEDATHEVFLPDTGDYFVDSYSAGSRRRGRPRGAGRVAAALGARARVARGERAVPVRAACGACRRSISTIVEGFQGLRAHPKVAVHRAANARPLLLGQVPERPH